MAYSNLKQKIANLYTQLDTFNEHSTQIKNYSLNNLPISNEKLKLYEVMIFQKKKNSSKSKDIFSKIKDEKKNILHSRSLLDYQNFENENIYKRKNTNNLNSNFQRKYDELKNYTNNLNNFEISNKENLRRNLSNYIDEIKNYKNIKNGKMLNKKESLKKEIMSELGTGYMNNNFNGRIMKNNRSSSNIFESKIKRKEFKGIHAVNKIY